jgi:hypothetical protein
MTTENSILEEHERRNREKRAEADAIMSAFGLQPPPPAGGGLPAAAAPFEAQNQAALASILPPKSTAKK